METKNPQQNSKQKNVVVAVAWPYVNGYLHIGHLAGYLLPADICARFNRLVGNNVLMVSGSDCHGTPITVEADKRGLTPQDIVDEYHKADVKLFLETLKLTYDNYTLTGTEHHAKVTQDIFLKMLEEGYIFIDSSEQYYSPTENKFLPDRYVEGECPNCGFKDARSDQCDNCGKLLEQGELINAKSKLSNEKVELKETQHYFADWEKLQPKIDAFVEKSSPNWKNWVAQETKGWLKEGLKARAITRDIDWGVKIPADKIPDDMQIEGIENKRFYVWFDAVIGYYSASLEWAQKQNNPDEWKKFWFADSAEENELYHYYFMGKDNLVFHTMLWPGQLMIFNKDLHLPDNVSINQFLNLDGKQFSKSRGVSIKIEDMIKEFGNDAVRFYLTLIMPETKDSSFTWEDFEQKVNGVLIANLGNFINRVLSIAKDTNVSAFSNAQLEPEVEQTVETTFKNSINHLKKCEFRSYLDEVLKLSAFGNHYVDKVKLWEIKKTDEAEFNKSLKQLYYIIIALDHLIDPLLFEASEKLSEFLQIKKLNVWPQNAEAFKSLENLITQVDTNSKPKPLFNKIELTEK